MELPEDVERADDDYVVLAENWETVRLFAALMTQWRLAPSGRLTGLDYAACEAAARGMKIKWRKVLAGIQVMEAEVLASQPKGNK